MNLKADAPIRRGQRVMLVYTDACQWGVTLWWGDNRALGVALHDAQPGDAVELEPESNPKRKIGGDA